MDKNNLEDNQLPFGDNPGLTIPQGDAGDRFRELMKNPENKRIYDERVKWENERGRYFILSENKIIDKPKEEAGQSVTVTLRKENYNRQPFDLGTTVRGGKGIRKSLISNPRAKAKMLAFKLKRKVWHPLFKTTTVDNTQPYQHIFTLKPFNF